MFIMFEAMKTTKNKLTVLLIIVAVLALLGWVIFSGFMQRGSSPIPKKKTDKIYTWKAASLRVMGKITPDKCALTTSKCKCTLSEGSPECLFNFTFDGLNHNTSIKVSDLEGLPSITYDTSKDCTSNAENKIASCSVTYKWDKSSPVSKDSQILLTGPDGTEALLTVQIEANNSN
jgi:hypothetical protein